MTPSVRKELNRIFKEYDWDSTNDIDWDDIVRCRKLSENFIREFEDEWDWDYIAECQKLSERFIREFQNKLDFGLIVIYQKLSEKFIREFRDELDCDYIAMCQKLSEKFIREFQDELDWYFIEKYQKLSTEFRKEFDLKIPESCWLYKSNKFKLDYIRKNTKYKITGRKYIIAYKSCRSDGHSVFNFQYKYQVGRTYESHCNCNIHISNSFGLSAWTKKQALLYHSKGKLFKVKIDVADLGAVVHDCKKIRCRKLEILEEIT